MINVLISASRKLRGSQRTSGFEHRGTDTPGVISDTMFNIIWLTQDIQNTSVVPSALKREFDGLCIWRKGKVYFRLRKVKSFIEGILREVSEVEMRTYVVIVDVAKIACTSGER